MPADIPSATLATKPLEITEERAGSAVRPAFVRWLDADDDVATAVDALASGTVVTVRSADVERRIVAHDDIPAGHKIAVRALAAGVRARKYGECIGRLTCEVAEGAWVHDHNLVSTAVRDARDDAAWAGSGDVDVEAVGDVRADIGRSVVFDAHDERLWWVDAGRASALHGLHLSSGRHRAWTMREGVASVALASGHRLVVTTRGAVRLCDPVTGALAPLANADAEIRDHDFGPAIADARGRLWCGARPSGSSEAHATLQRLDADGALTRVASGWVAPGGIVVDAHGATLLASDTRRGFVEAFDIHDDGTLGGRRVLADLGALPGGPAGGALDADGCTWWTMCDGGALLRLRPDGRLDRIIRLPVSRPTSCAFGGAGLARLLVTTASRGTRAIDEPLAGRLLALDVGVTGRPAHAFTPDEAVR